MQKYALVFPGQGSQVVGMLQELATHFPSVEGTFREASEVLGTDLWKLTQEGPAEQLNRTEWAQPVMLTADIAVLRVWQELHPRSAPEVMAGHSLGEYAALVAAEVISFDVALKLVALRGKLMQEAYTGESAMLAVIGLTDEEVETVCHDAVLQGIVEIANLNSPGQVVLSGEKNAVEKAAELAKAAGAKMVKLLKVSVPSHCSLMKPAALKLASELADIEFKSPTVPVIQNVTAAITSDVDEISDLLVRQLYSPVRWVETVKLMVQQGVTAVLECGPGKVLTNLNKRIDPDLVRAELSCFEQLQQFTE